MTGDLTLNDHSKIDGPGDPAWLALACTGCTGSDGNTQLALPDFDADQLSLLRVAGGVIERVDQQPIGDSPRAVIGMAALCVGYVSSPVSAAVVIASDSNSLALLCVGCESASQADPGFREVLDAKLSGFQPGRVPHAFRLGSGQLEVKTKAGTATQPLAPSAFEREAAARLAYAHSGRAFAGNSRGQPFIHEPRASPATTDLRLRVDSDSQRVALARLQQLGASELTGHALESDLKRAFRRLARERHPDSHAESARRRSRSTHHFRW